ncbi:MAG TPA: hypothetical protein VFU81_17720 [Thermomicrobiales bacterium]|nr:hypothetical protein [Thermomicrobiales bacterium]
MHALTMLVRLSSRPIRRLAAIAPVLALQAALIGAPLPGAAQSPPPAACAPITGRYIDVEGATGTFDGCFAARRLSLAAGRPALAGDLSLRLRDPAGQQFATLHGAATLPVNRFDASNGALRFTLAPSRVVVAGLQAYVDAVDLELPVGAVASGGDAPADPGWSCGMSSI